MERIYLDYASGAPLLPVVQKKLQHYFSTLPVGNPSSLHTEGRKKQAILDETHTRIAGIVGVHPTEVVLTSGATESNNLAIQGTLAAWRREHPGQTPHIIMSEVEHPSWYATAEREEAEITKVPVSSVGGMAVEDVIGSIQPNTAVVGCAYVNNEIGVVLPIAEIGKQIEQYRTDKQSKWPVFHTDAVQAFPYLNCHIGHLHADSITFSGHKYGALEGIGCLIVRKRLKFEGVRRGGRQEWGIRAGTENIVGALSLGTAMVFLDENRQEMTEHVRQLQEHLELNLQKHLPAIKILAESSRRAPHISYLWIPEITDEHIMHKLDLHGIAVASGSACSSGAALPSATLLALGFNEPEAYGGIRVSFGWATTRQEIDTFVQVFVDILRKEGELSLA